MYERSTTTAATTALVENLRCRQDKFPSADEVELSEAIPYSNNFLIPDCGTVYNLEDGHVDFVEVDVTYTQKVNITCNDGYYSTTHEHIECLSDGKWSEVECRHGKSLMLGNSSL